MADPVAAKPGTFTERGVAEATIAKALLVKAGSASNGLALNGATNTPLGIAVNIPNPSSTNFPAATTADEVEYAPCGANGWYELTASGVIAAGGEFVAAASGKIAALATSGGGQAKPLGILHPNSRAAAADGDIVIGRLYATPSIRVIAGGTEGNVVVFDAAGQPVDDGGYAAGDAVTLYTLTVEEPEAADDGKVLSYDHATTSFKWIANT